MRSHKEILNKHKITLLKKAARQVVNSEKNEFNIGIFRDNITDYNNLQKLRYHGLITHIKVNGVIQRGKWLITRNGFSFLKGETGLPKWVEIEENRIVAQSDNIVFIEDVYKGSEAVATTFEYFNNNKAIGWRPTAPSEIIQTKLI